MKVLYIEPLRSPRLINIDPSLESIRAAIHCQWIEAADLLPDAVLICDEEGKLNGSQPNRIVEGDLVFGSFLIAGLGEDDFTDLSQPLIEKYTEKYKYPEVFIPAPDGHIAVIRVVEAPI